MNLEKRLLKNLQFWQMPAYSLIGIFDNTRNFEKLQVQFIFQILS